MQRREKNMCLFSSISLRLFYTYPLISTKPFISLFSSLSASTQPASPNNLITNYFIKTFNFSRARALLVSNRNAWVKSPDKPQSVVIYFQELGFSESHIQSLVRSVPQILFYRIDETLKPKIQFFQRLGVMGPDLGKLVSKNLTLLTCSLENRLSPCVNIFKSILDNKNDQDLIKVLMKINWAVAGGWKSRILCNIALLESYGIVGSQLSNLLKRRPGLFLLLESELRCHVLQVQDMGLSVYSRLFPHALSVVSCLSRVTLQRKLELIQSFGFSKEECLLIFRRAPNVLGCSENKLKLGLEFFLNTVKLDKKVLTRCPVFLMYSMEKRLLPRYKVFLLIKTKKLMEKEPTFRNMVCYTEEKFIQKFVVPFGL